MTLTEESLPVSNECTAPETDDDWIAVCESEDLHLERGAAALVHGNAIALFRVAFEGSDRVYAVSHIDPLSGTPTLARGIVGSHDDRPIIAAPLLKERYDLATGERVDSDGPGLAVFPVRVHEGKVEVRANVICG